MINKFISLYNFIFNKDYRFLKIAKFGGYKKMQDDIYLKKMYKARLNKELDLENPKTLNQKMQWLKINDRKDVYTTMVDKYEAKKYVASIIGEQYIIETLGVWDNANEIDFDKLPNIFVLKTTHDSGGVKIINKNSNDYNEKAIRKFFNNRLKRSLYYITREWPYKNVKPRIIAEKYMESIQETDKSQNIIIFNSIAKCKKEDCEKFIGSFSNYYNKTSNELNLGNQKITNNGIADAVSIHLKNSEKTYISKQLIQFRPLLCLAVHDKKNNDFCGELMIYPALQDEKFLFDYSRYDVIDRWLNIEETYIMIKKDLFLVYKPINNRQSNILIDYKFFTFDGEPKLLMVNYDRGLSTKADYFDLNLNKLDFTWGYPQSNYIFIPPLNYKKMIDFSRLLSKGTKELRVDFYECNHSLFFGELTFFDGSGFTKIEPESWDYLLGEYLNI